MPRLSICLTALLAALAMNAEAQTAVSPASMAKPDMQQACEKPVYPPEAVEGRWSGTSTIFLLVGEDGTVKDAKVTKSSGYRALDRAALAAFSRCRFKPPMADGKPVQAWMPIQYVWSPE
jgi:TonB family protein